MRKYINYWKKTFDYKSVSKLSEFFSALLGNILILVILNILGIFIPITWENGLVNLIYIIQVAMIFPTISLLVRLIKNSH